MEFYMVVIEFDVELSFNFLDLSEEKWAQSWIEVLCHPFTNYISSLEESCFKFSDILIRLQF